eukprot:s8_g18.t1
MVSKEKRMTVQYDVATENRGFRRLTSPFQAMRPRKLSFISEEVHQNVNQRLWSSLRVELLACLYHRNQKFLEDYEYTSQPPTIIGSGFSGDVVLCRSKKKTAVVQNQEIPGSFKDPWVLLGPPGWTFVRCVKRFNLTCMGPEKLEKLKNEAVIYLSLEHPHIARLFDVYEDDQEVSLVMQYCAGGTLESAIRSHGAFSESRFQELAFPMLLTDIKPRNWVYEADGQTIKLIDFGFSVKGYLSTEGLKGCMGTLGYLAPEVVTAGLSNENAYTDKCDIWSLGVVFVELLTGEAAFHRDAGQCDGYTEEVVLREIKEVTDESIERILEQVPPASRGFLAKMLTKDPKMRSTAQSLLTDAYLSQARQALCHPPKALPVSVILDRFRCHAKTSQPTRAWLLAEFTSLRDTFKMFDARGLSGVVNLETFLEVIQEVCQDSRSMWQEQPDDSPRKTVSKVWKAVCGEQESLSYCEFLAMLFPPMEDIFEDATRADGQEELNSPLQPREHWNPGKPVKRSASSLFPQALLFDEDQRVNEDINHRLVKEAGPCWSKAAECLQQICDAQVGDLANCSGFCSFVALDVETPLRDVLHLIAGRHRKKRQGQVRRVPLRDGKEIVGVFSCLDFLNLALKSTAPTAVLKSLSAKVFDRRSTILQDEPMLHALTVMKAEGLTICPCTFRELSGSLGGVVASNVISTADLKWVVRSGDFAALHLSVQDFVAWRRKAESSDLDHILRQQRFMRFNVVSASEDASLHTLARRLVDSKLQRIFLSSDDIARIVGIDPEAARIHTKLKKEVRLLRFQSCVTHALLISFEILLILRLEGVMTASWVVVICPWLALEVWWFLFRIYVSPVAWALSDPQAATEAGATHAEVRRTPQFLLFLVGYLQAGFFRFLTSILISARANAVGHPHAVSWWLVFLPLYFSAALFVAIPCLERVVKRRRQGLLRQEEDNPGPVAAKGCVAIVWLMMVWLAAGKLDGGAYSAAWVFWPIFFFVSLAVCVLGLVTILARPQHFQRLTLRSVRVLRLFLQTRRWHVVAIVARRNTKTSDYPPLPLHSPPGVVKGQATCSRSYNSSSQFR